jgi:HlyD family secretion protein
MVDSEQHDANPALLHVATPEEFFPPVSSWSRVGGAILVIAFVALLLLCSVLRYKVTVQAQAAIRPAGELRIVQAQIGGQIQDILVTQNQTVEAGTVIAYVDDSHLRTEQSKLRTAIDNASLQVEQLQTQLTAFDLQIEAEQDLMQRRQSTARAALRLREREREQQLVTTAADVDEAQAQVDLAREELSRYTTLAERGVVSELEIKELQAKLRAAEAQLTRVEAALNPSAAQIEIASANIVQERARGAATLARLRREREQLLQRVTDNQSILDNQEEDLRQNAADIASAVVRAPVTGVIQLLTLRNPGQMVEKGELIARIALADNALEVKAFVAIQDIGDVAIGQPVFMRVSACPYPDYGTLQATVIAISPDAITSQNPSRAIERGARLASTTGYEVTARPDTLVLEDAGRSCEIQAGMEGRADIVSREETVLRFLLRKVRLAAGV